MERINPVTADRHDVIDRLRQQVADGAYRPPVDELVNRLVSVVMAQRADRGYAPVSAGAFAPAATEPRSTR